MSKRVKIYSIIAVVLLIATFFYLRILGVCPKKVDCFPSMTESEISEIVKIPFILFCGYECGSY